MLKYSKLQAAEPSADQHLASVLCLFIDAYAIFTLPHRSVRGSPSTSLSNVALWAFEAVIGLLALWLLRFAFSWLSRPLPDT